MYTTDDVFLAAFLVFAYSEPQSDEYVVKRVLLDPDTGRIAEIQLDIPEEDGKAYAEDFDNGCLAISDLREYKHRHSRIMSLVKLARRDGIEWVAPERRSEQWWANARCAVEARRAEREDRERKANHRNN